jgi:hypothetical protein
MEDEKKLRLKRQVLHHLQSGDAELMVTEATVKAVEEKLQIPFDEVERRLGVKFRIVADSEAEGEGSTTLCVRVADATRDYEAEGAVVAHCLDCGEKVFCDPTSTGTYLQCERCALEPEKELVRH